MFCHSSRVRLDIDSLRTLRAIVESGSFTGASARLHLTQSAVSWKIKRLEERLGHALLVRDGKTIELPENKEIDIDAKTITKDNVEAYWARLKELPNIDFRPGIGFAQMLARSNEAIVTLSDGHQLSTKLVIGADGRNSAVRRAAGIDVKTTRYGQKALTFAVTHDAPHDNISTEIHRSGGPFTLVPLPDHDGKPCSAVVWMEHGDAAMRLAALSEADFEAAANERSAYLYGPLKLASRRSIWPIISQIAQDLTAPRTALVAEAAHVMPPIGAQGLNISLKDLSCLLDLAIAQPDQLGAPKMLDTYARQRHPDIKLRVTGIDALNRASIAGNPMMQSLRSKGIEALYGVTPIRRTLMQMGLGAR